MKKLIIAAVLLLASAVTFATGNHPGYVAQDEWPTLNSPEIYDSLLGRWHSENVVSSYEAFFRDFVNIEADSTLDLSAALPDSIYVARLRMMVSPIYLPYNDILRKYIVTYTTTRRKTMAHMLGLSQYYFPMIEQELSNAGLPLELRMLPVIESALSPTAVSRMGATGMWQFMYPTGKAQGLEITSFIDQRRDPVAATRAACLYLSKLYKMYGEWTLAIAAYNCGEGNVNKAIKRAGDGVRNFWDIYNFLPPETRAYVPSFVAATYAYNFHKLHNIDPVPAPMPMMTDTIMVGKMMHLEQVSSTIGAPMEMLRELNPQYFKDIIPSVGNKCYALTMPSSYVLKFIEQQDEIYAKDSVYLAQYVKMGPKMAAAQLASGAGMTTHKVKSGEVLGSIARKYGVSVSQIVKWNNLKSANAIIRPGQVLRIQK